MDKEWVPISNTPRLFLLLNSCENLCEELPKIYSKMLL